MMSRRPRAGQRVRWIGWGLALALMVGLGFGLTRTTTYRQGINFQVREIQIPVWRKVWHFLDRHWQTQELLNNIIRGATTPEEKTLKIFRWTNEQVLPPPPSLPVVDDHVINIVIRGYGGNDQAADVFTTLLAYAGIEAKMHRLRARDYPRDMIITTVWLKGSWRAFDPFHGNYFINHQGQMATVEDLVADLSLVGTAPNPVVHEGLPYIEYFKGLPDLDLARGFNRGWLQMPWPRFVYEVKRLVGLGRMDALSSTAGMRPSRKEAL